MKPRVAMTVINDLSTDRRVHKHSLLLAEMGCHVALFGRKSNRSLPVPDVAELTRLLRIPFKRGPMMYITFNLSLFINLLFTRADIFWANDLDTLLPCFLVSRIRKKKLVYDSHEYFTGQYGLAERKVTHFIWKSLERVILPRLGRMMTVSDSIARLYESEYDVRCTVVRNIAPSSEHIIPSDRNIFAAVSGHLLVVCQGSGLNRGRGLEAIIEAVISAERVKMLLIGSGDAVTELKRYVAAAGGEEKIAFLPPMPWEEMMSITKCCDAGISADTDTCINQRYSLPNKLFDYISAGIPVIVSPLVELSALVKKYGCGYILPETSSGAITEALTAMRDNRDFAAACRAGVAKARADLDWESEKRSEQKFISDVLEEIKSNE